MRRQAGVAVLCAAALLSAAAAFPQGSGLNRPLTLSLSTNPVKLAESLVNLDAQLNLLPQISLFAFGEALLADYAIKRTVHPDAVAHAGARWHILAGPEGGGAWDLNAGLSAGATWSGTASLAGPIGVAEVGGKWLFWGPLFIYGRGMLTVNLTGPVFTPGFEGHVGITLN
jgi:hypothetical protein